MKVFVAGGSGAIGRRLVPLLVANGHEVTATTRSAAKTEALRAAGAEPVIADGLDPAAVMQAVTRAAPEVVVHQMTGLAGVTSYRRFDHEFALTNRLRADGTDHLLAAARAAGARRVVVQSYAGWTYGRGGGEPRSESDPLDPSPLANQVESLAALRHLEAAVHAAPGIEGLVLRYVSLYGPGTSLGRDGDLARLVRKRQLPVIGGGAGVWSFVHVDDAASATLAAIERGAPGIYNVADDEPAAVAAWLPQLAAALGAKPPRHIPAWLGRLAAGEVAVATMTRIAGVANAKARRELAWTPRYPSWREGFRGGLDG